MRYIFEGGKMNIEFKLANENDVKKIVEVQSKSFYQDF